MLYYVWEGERRTSQKSNSQTDGMIISSNTGNLQGKLTEKIFPDKKTNEIVRMIDGWIRKVKEKMDKFVLQKIPISSKEPKEGTALFL